MARPASRSTVPSCADPGSGRFRTAQPLTTPRSAHTATLLPDGRVLVIGGTGVDGTTSATAELWDPADGTFAPTGSLLTARSHHAATLLPDGRVLVVGGQSAADAGVPIALASVETWEPATGMFTVAGSLAEGRTDVTATLLNDGRVLIVGGTAPGAPALDSAMVWDPVRGTFASAGTLEIARSGHTATLMDDGRVLIVGGDADVDAPVAGVEVWDPATNSFASAGTLAAPRSAHTATLLPDGRVAVIAGEGKRTLSSVEVWDPRTGGVVWSVPGPLQTARSDHTATLLADGRVLLAGGVDDAGSSIASAEVWDPRSGRTTRSAPLRAARAEHAAVLLQDGRVLVVGGEGGIGGAIASIEIWDPATRAFVRSGKLRAARWAPGAARLADGRVLIVGDRESDGPMTAEIWDPATQASGAARVVGNGQWFSKTVLLADGRLLVVGVGDSTQDAQVWDPVTRKATRAGTMLVDRVSRESVTLLQDGRVLVVGGWDPANDDGRGLASAEVWDPATDTFARAGSLGEARTGHTATLLADGRVLIVGGTTAADGGHTLATAEIWDPGHDDLRTRGEDGGRPAGPHGDAARGRADPGRRWLGRPHGAGVHRGVGSGDWDVQQLCGRSLAGSAIGGPKNPRLPPEPRQAVSSVGPIPTHRSRIMVIETLAPSQPAAAVRPLTVAVCGATGLVGQTMMTVLGERGFPVGELRPLASRADGRSVSFGGREWPVQVSSPDAFEGVDIALFSAGGDVSKMLAPEAAARGAVVIDNSAQWRMEPGIPLVVSQVNPEDAAAHEGIIANPNCSTMQLVPLLMALRDTVGLERVIVDTYQSVSGTGAEAVAELEAPGPRLGRGRPLVSHRSTPTRSPSTCCRRSMSSGTTATPRKSGRSSPRAARSCTCRTCGSHAPLSVCPWCPPTRRRSTWRRASPSPPSVPASCSPRCPESWSSMIRAPIAIRWPSMRPAATTSSLAGSVPTPPWTTAAAWRSGSSRTTSARERPPTRCRSPRSCWSGGGWLRRRGELRCRPDAPRGHQLPRPRRRSGRVCVTTAQRTTALEAIAAEVRVCTRCRLSEGRTKAVPGEGSPDTEVVFVGEGPGQNEDQQGRPFVGAAGGLLTELIGSIGWQRDQVFITNVVKCRPPGNRDPEPDEMAACAPYLRRQLEVLDPALVVTLGRYSLGTFMPGARIGQVHGTARPVGAGTGTRDALAFAMYHPAAAFRQMSLKETMREDMARIPAALIQARESRMPAPEIPESVAAEADASEAAMMQSGAEPASAEPASLEPGPAEPAPPEPASLAPAAAEPALAEPTAVEPDALTPAAAEPAAAELAPVEPAAPAENAAPPEPVEPEAPSEPLDMTAYPDDPEPIEPVEAYTAIDMPAIPTDHPPETDQMRLF